MPVSTLTALIRMRRFDGYPAGVVEYRRGARIVIFIGRLTRPCRGSAASPG